MRARIVVLLSVFCQRTSSSEVCAVCERAGCGSFLDVLQGADCQVVIDAGAALRGVVHCFVVLVVRVVSCLCLGCGCLDVVDGKVIRSRHRCLISSDVSSVIVTVGTLGCAHWFAAPQLSASAATRMEWESIVALLRCHGWCCVFF